MTGGSPGRLRYVALGDSYTIGTSVDESERWPNQLVERVPHDALEDVLRFQPGPQPGAEPRADGEKQPVAEPVVEIVPGLLVPALDPCDQILRQPALVASTGFRLHVAAS